MTEAELAKYRDVKATNQCCFRQLVWTYYEPEPGVHDAISRCPACLVEYHRTLSALVDLDAVV